MCKDCTQSQSTVGLIIHNELVHLSDSRAFSRDELVESNSRNHNDTGHTDRPAQPDRPLRVQVSLVVRERLDGDKAENEEHLQHGGER